MRTKPFQMRILLSSLCVFLLMACGSYPKKQGFVPSANTSKELLNPYFSDVSKDYVYKAKIDAFQKSFGGIFVVKKLGNDHHRIVFTTEMGNTIYDFEFQGVNFKINRILPEMDKKLLINVLKRDFLALIKENPPRTKYYSKADNTIAEATLQSKKHYYTFEDGQLKKIVQTGSGKEKVTFLFSGISDNIAKKIVLSHHNFKLQIVLTAF